MPSIGTLGGEAPDIRGVKKPTEQTRKRAGRGGGKAPGRDISVSDPARGKVEGFSKLEDNADALGSLQVYHGEMFEFLMVVLDIIEFEHRRSTTTPQGFRRRYNRRFAGMLGNEEMEPPTIDPIFEWINKNISFEARTMLYQAHTSSGPVLTEQGQSVVRVENFALLPAAPNLGMQEKLIAAGFRMHPNGSFEARYFDHYGQIYHDLMVGDPDDLVYLNIQISDDLLDAYFTDRASRDHESDWSVRSKPGSQEMTKAMVRKKLQQQASRQTATAVNRTVANRVTARVAIGTGNKIATRVAVGGALEVGVVSSGVAVTMTVASSALISFSVGWTIGTAIDPGPDFFLGKEIASPGARELYEFHRTVLKGELDYHSSMDNDVAMTEELLDHVAQQMAGWYHGEKLTSYSYEDTLDIQANYLTDYQSALIRRGENEGGFMDPASQPARDGVDMEDFYHDMVDSQLEKISGFPTSAQRVAVRSKALHMMMQEMIRYRDTEIDLAAYRETLESPSANNNIEWEGISPDERKRLDAVFKQTVASLMIEILMDAIQAQGLAEYQTDTGISIFDRFKDFMTGDDPDPGGGSYTGQLESEDPFENMGSKMGSGDEQVDNKGPPGHQTEKERLEDLVSGVSEISAATHNPGTITHPDTMPGDNGPFSGGRGKIRWKIGGPADGGASSKGQGGAGGKDGNHSGGTGRGRNAAGGSGWNRGDGNNSSGSSGGSGSNGYSYGRSNQQDSTIVVDIYYPSDK
ncbi:MAG: hypothetical protein AAFV53_27460 [Myxococcota bacterium]